MVFSASAASQEKLSADLEEPHPPGESLKGSLVARPLVPVTLALMVGIAAPAWGLTLPEPWLLAGGAALWIVLALFWRQRRPVRFLPVIFFALLGVAFHQQARQPDFSPGHLAKLPQHQNLTLFGHLNRPGKLAGEREQLFMEALAWRSPWGWRPATGNLLVLAPVPEPPPVGTGLVVRGRLASPHILQNPGTFNRPRFLAADGLFREVRLSDPHRLIFLAATDAYPWAERLRGGIRERLRELDPAGRAIYLAMLLGDQGEITPAMRQNFARTGTSHLLVINGLHLGMVAAVTYFLSFWLLRRFPRLLLRVNAVKIATLLAAIPVVFYAWVAGGSPSTQRAEVMVLAYLLLVFLGRPGEVWSALALAALVILSLSPLRLFSISFQLSFVAVAALIYLLPRLVEWISGTESDSSCPGCRGPPPFPDQGVVYGVGGGHPGHRAPGGLLFPGGLPPGHPGQPGGHSPGPAPGPAAGGGRGHLPGLVPDPGGPGPALRGQTPPVAGVSGDPVGGQGPRQRHHHPHPHLADDCRLLCRPDPGLLSPAHAPDLGRGGPGGAGVGDRRGPAPGHDAPGPGSDLPGCLRGAGRGGGEPGEPAAGGFGGGAPPAGAGPPRVGGRCRDTCHWRQFRRMDLAIALNLSESNAGELLTLARQFTVGAYWYGRRERDGPAYWDLANYLGDRRATPRSLDRGSPPSALGGVDLRYVKLTPDAAPALEVAYQGQRVLLIPPVGGLAADDLPAAAEPFTALVIPAGTGRPPGAENHPGPPEPRAGGRLRRLRPVRRGPGSLARALPFHPGGGGEPSV